MALEDIAAQEFEGWILVTATANGWQTLRSTASHNASAPDIVLARSGEMVVAKVRTHKASRSVRLSDKQTAWLTAARSVPGADAYVWGPSDMPEAWARLTRPANNPRAKDETGG